MQQPAPATRHVVLAAVILALVTLTVYSSTFGFGIVNYDDDAYLTTRPEVMNGLSPANVKWAFTSCEYGNYFPVMWLSYQLEETLWGPKFGRFHATNVALHVSTVVMLMLFLVHTTGALWRSIAVAALFALHPAHVESVAWLAERKDVLSTAFGMASLLAYVRYARRPSAPRMLCVCLLLMLAMLSKSMLVTWPAVLLLVDYWPMRRVRSGTNSAAIDALPAPTSPTFSIATPRRLVLEKLPLFAMSLGISVVTFYAQRLSHAVSGIEQLTLHERIANALVGYTRYIGLLLWPVDLALLYPLKTLPLWQPVGALALICAITIVVLRSRVQRPYLLFGWLWFLGTLVPVIGLVQVGVQSIADRYSYIPHMGLLIAIVWGTSESDVFQRFRPAMIAIWFALLIVLGSATWKQTLYWRDSITLWRHSLDVSKDSAGARSSLAAAYIEIGRDDLALPYYIENAKAGPLMLDLQNTTGMLLLKLGRPAEAVPYLRAASRRPGSESDVGSYVANVNLIKALRSSGRTDEAEAELRSLLNDPAVPRLLVEAEFDLPAAIAQYRTQVQANPDNAVARNVLGVALARSGDVRGAVEQFKAALKINPSMSDARENLEHAESILSLPQYTPGQTAK